MPERLRLATPLSYTVAAPATVEVSEVQINVVRLDWAHDLVQIEIEDERGVVRYVSYKGKAGAALLAAIAASIPTQILARVVADGLIEGGTMREVKA